MAGETWEGEKRGGEGCPSTQHRYHVFLERYQSKWSNILPFRAPTEFPECDACHELKESIKRARAAWPASAWPGLVNSRSEPGNK